MSMTPGPDYRPPLDLWTGLQTTSGPLDRTADHLRTGLQTTSGLDYRPRPEPDYRPPLDLWAGLQTTSGPDYRPPQDRTTDHVLNRTTDHASGSYHLQKLAYLSCSSTQSILGGQPIASQRLAAVRPLCSVASDMRPASCWRQSDPVRSSDWVFRANLRSRIE